MANLTAFTEADRGEVMAFLAHPDGLHVYLQSRLDGQEGEAFVWRDRGRVEGLAWFGPGRNFVIAGDAAGLAGALAPLARERERSWVMVVGPHGVTSDFLFRFHRLGGRRPRLDRAQTFCVQRRETLPPLREPGLLAATEGDLPELSAAAARMSAEDFEIDPFRIDREAVRRAMAAKVRTGRAFLCREEGRLVFKVDMAVVHPAGGQVEGVFTAEDSRGRGIATRAMAELGHRFLEELPLLTLHVNSRNAPALRAYQKAGYVPVADLRLAIFPPVW